MGCGIDVCDQHQQIVDQGGKHAGKHWIVCRQSSHLVPSFNKVGWSQLAAFAMEKQTFFAGMIQLVERKQQIEIDHLHRVAAMLYCQKVGTSLSQLEMLEIGLQQVGVMLE